MFRQEPFVDYACLEMFRYHLVWWVKSAWGEAVPFVSDVNWFLGEILASPYLVPISHNVTWSPPPHKTIKVNMNDSFSCAKNWSRIKNIFHDFEGNMLHFAKHINVEIVIHVKILTIRKDIFIVAPFRWSSSVIFQFEFNSSNAVAWFLNQFRNHDISRTPFGESIRLP